MHIRQIALVARELEPVVADLRAVLGIEVGFRDPGVAEFGLHNAVMPVGATFLEVVSPVREGTTAGRLLDRRGGDGGYMVILQTVDLRADRARLAALVSAVQTMAKELGASGVRVNSVVPGFIWGPALERWFQQLAHEQGTTPEVVSAEIASRTALNHIPDSDEVAAAVVFFASDLSRAVTGQALDVNGGHYFH